MTLYLDSSALLAVLLDEPTAERVRDRLTADPDWVTGRHTSVEVRRNLARFLAGERLEDARRLFARHWGRTTIIELDEETCALAADAAERTGARTLDALHLGAAQRAGALEITMVTLDVRLRDAARELGMPTSGIDDEPLKMEAAPPAVLARQDPATAGPSRPASGEDLPTPDPSSTADRTVVDTDQVDDS